MMGHRVAAAAFSRRRVPGIWNQIGRVIVPLLGACFVLGVMLVADEGKRVAAGLAAFNVLLLSSALFFWVTRGRVEHAVITLFLPGIMSSWPLASLYFALFEPDATYANMWGETEFLLHNERIQLVVLAFSLAYCAFTFPLLKKSKKREAVGPVGISPTEIGIIWLGLLSVLLGWIPGLVSAPQEAAFVGAALRNYFSGFLFLAGYNWMLLSRRMKVIVAGVILASAFANTVANARGYALFPVLMCIFGFFLSPTVSRKTRAMVFALSLVSYPVYMIVGNQTRSLMSSIGFENFSERAQILTNVVREGAFDYGQKTMLGEVLGRQFGSGGHALVVYNWDSRDLGDFDPLVWMEEFLKSLPPAFVFGEPADAKYVGNARLTDFGFLINESTSVEVSLLGSLFDYGGLWIVVAGGIGVALFHTGIVRWLGLLRPSALRLTVLSSLLTTSLLAYNVDVVQLVRALLWQCVYSLVAYFGVRFALVVVGSVTKPRWSPVDRVRLRPALPARPGSEQ